MKNKGFTLIELMGVIIILSTIMILAFPPIINLIKGTENKIGEGTLSLIYSAVDIYVDNNKNDYPIYSGNTYCISLQDLVNTRVLKEPIIDSKTGNKLSLDKVIKMNINSISDIDYYLVESNECEPYNYFTDNKIPVFNEEKGVNVPILSTDMIPVVYNETTGNWDGTTRDNVNWYDYSNKKWANAKTKDGSFWVWIPRYAYKITSEYHTETAGTIDIKFLKGTTNESVDATVIETSGYKAGEKDTSTNYFLHPAFSFDGEKSGFWMAKFEPSVANESDACYTSASSDNCNKIDLVPTFKPNKTSWRYITIGNAYTVSKNMKNNSEYGWNSGEVDTHLMKNTEWGAVIYLSKSVYGANDEIWNNSFDGYKTGCSGTGVNASNETTCVEYNSENGVKASTTYNIYGVYDMSRGARERVAGYVNNGNSNLQTYGGSLVNETDLKYKNVYVVAEDDSWEPNYQKNKNVYGDAIYETSSTGNSSTGSWYREVSFMSFDSTPFISRGGGEGSYSFGDTSGDVHSGSSFRSVFFVK